MNEDKITHWQSYEEVARHLLNEIATEFGVDFFEGKQEIEGKRSGTTWEIDGKGVATADGKILLLECRRYTTCRQKQEQVAAVAYRITDTGADGAIIVSPLGLQEGGRKVAEAEKIVEVKLNASCTTTEYVLQFLNQVHVGMRFEVTYGMTVSAEVRRKGTA